MSYELEDIWLKAFHAFPDLMPLVRLLRSDIPMPSGARNLLAELLCPGDPPIDSYVLELKQNPEFDKMIKQMSVAADYSLLMSAGDSSQEAAEKAGRNHYMGERQAYRRVRQWTDEKTAQRLGDRLRGRDTKAD